MKKQLLSALLAGVLLISMTACGEAESEPSSMDSLTGQRFTGTVSAISAEELLLDTQESGTIAIPLSSDTVFQRGQPGMGGQAPDGAGSDEKAPPEAPGEANTDRQAPPDMPDGTAPDGETFPDVPDAAPADAEKPADAPDGSVPGNMPQETLCYEDISAGDTVTVEVGEDGIAASVTISGGGPGGGMGEPSDAPDSHDAANMDAEDT